MKSVVLFAALGLLATASVASAAIGPPDVATLVKCVGDALNGNACHTAEASAAGPEGVVECAKSGVRNVLQGTPQPCYPGEVVATAGPDVGKAVDCVKSGARDILAGVTPEPCTIN